MEIKLLKEDKKRKKKKKNKNRISSNVSKSMNLKSKINNGLLNLDYFSL